MTTVSIITATYNSAKTVADTLTSVQHQRYPAIEHIIIDGQSTDDTLQIVAAFPHVKKVVSGKDKGIYDAMNKGITASTGEIIGILNSDDFYVSDQVIGRVVEKMEASGSPLLYADLEYVEKENTNKVVRYWKSGNYGSHSFEMGWMPPHPTFFVRREIYEQYGCFNLAMASAADYEIMLRLMHRFRIKAAYLPEVIVRMRTGGASNKTLLHRFRANKEDKLAWQLNQLHPHPFTFLFKPLRKLLQYVQRNQSHVRTI